MSTATDYGLEVTFELGGQVHRAHFESGNISIGRRPNCDLVIKDPSISRQHAVVSLSEGQWVLQDCDSANGLQVRGKPIKKLMLHERELVVFGDVAVVFRVCMPVEIESGMDTHQLSSVNMGDLDTLLDSVFQEGMATTKGQEGSLQTKSVIRILRDATDALLNSEDLDSLLEKVLDLVFEHLPVNRAHILFYDEEKESLVPRLQRAAPGMPPERLRISRHIANAAIRSKQAVLVEDAGSDHRFSAAASVVSLGIRSAMCAPLCHKGRVGGLIYVDRRARNVFSRMHLEILSILASLSAAAVERALLQAKVVRERGMRERLSRYHAPAVVDCIVGGDEDGSGGMTAEEKEVSVLFVDIVGFTGFSENRPAREVTDFLNEIFQMLTEEVFRAGGTLDKFMGDAIMVFFGAPLPQPDHAERAVRTALAMQAHIARFNESQSQEEPIAIRIGVNTGLAIVGDVGTVQRRDYTVIGETVNTACRLEASVARKGQIVIGPETQARVAEKFLCQPLEQTSLRGMTETIQPWLVLSEQSSVSRGESSTP